MGCDSVPASEATVVDASMPTQQGRPGSGEGELPETRRPCRHVWMCGPSQDEVCLCR